MSSPWLFFFTSMYSSFFIFEFNANVSDYDFKELDFYCLWFLWFFFHLFKIWLSWSWLNLLVRDMQQPCSLDAVMFRDFDAVHITNLSLSAFLLHVYIYVHVHIYMHVHIYPPLACLDDDFFCMFDSNNYSLIIRFLNNLILI